MIRPRNSMDLLSSASLSESVTSPRAVFRRLKRALFGGAFLFPTESRSPCYSTRSIPIGGITKEKQLHFLDLTERLFGLKNQTSPLPIKCWLRDRLCADDRQIRLCRRPDIPVLLGLFGQWPNSCRNSAARRSERATRAESELIPKAASAVAVGQVETEKVDRTRARDGSRRT
jgi:hypothetical protein